MTVSRRWWWLLGLALACGGAAAGKDPAQPPRTRIEGTLPGPVLGHAVVDGSAGRALYLLVRPADGNGEADATPRELWRLVESGGESTLERVRDGLAPEASALHVASLNGEAALLTALSGRIVALDGSRETVVLEDAAIRPRGVQVWAGDGEPDVLTVAGLGRTRVYGSGLDPRGDLPRYKGAGFRRHGLTVASPREEGLRDEAGRLHFGARPIQVSPRRLRGNWSTLARDGVGNVDWWAALPAEEELLEHAFVTFGGEPALWITTRTTAKLALFGEKQVRMYRMRADRSRMGRRPFFATETRANLWQAVTPYVRDADGDGHEDLILAYWKGLKDNRVVLDVYRGDGDGGLETSSRATAFDVKDADRGYLDFGGDVDGDGRPDLLLRAGDELRVHRGLAEGKRAVDSRPSHVAVLGDGAGGEAGVVVSVGGSGVHTTEATGAPPRPLRLDLDGDGVDDVLQFTPLEDGSVRLTLLRFGS